MKSKVIAFSATVLAVVAGIYVYNRWVEKKNAQ